jgi:TonB family protein
MNRLQKKCIIASVALHALLVLVLVFGAALMPPEKITSPPIITMFDPRLLTDEKTSGGVATPPPPPPPPTVQTPPQPDAPPLPNTQPPPRVEPRPQPARDNPPPTRNPRPPELQLVQRNTNPRPAPRSTPPAPQPDAQAQAQQDAQRRQQIQKQIRGAMQSINDKYSPATTVVAPGPGGDSVIMANYNDLVGNKYRDAWNPPPSLDDNTATVTASVVIYRDGRVKSHEIIQRSGNAAMDKSIEATLQNVTFVGPFPAESRDLERKFTIKFNLAAKRAIG